MCFFTLIANTFCSLNLKMAHKRPCFCCSKAIIDEVNGWWIEVLECSTYSKHLLTINFIIWVGKTYILEAKTNEYLRRQKKLIDT